jgi:hypothetical protein
MEDVREQVLSDRIVLAISGAEELPTFEGERKRIDAFLSGEHNDTPDPDKYELLQALGLRR